MEEVHIDNIQRENPDTSEKKVQDNESFLDLSFIPPELEEPRSLCEKCAIASVVFGGISIVSWVIIIIGLTVSVTGIVLGFLGLKSRHVKHARIGLGLSIAGFIISILYAIAASRGMIHSSFFTTQLLSS